MGKKLYSSTSIIGGDGTNPYYSHLSNDDDKRYNPRRRNVSVNISVPDYVKWAKYDYWKNEEACLLIADIEPDDYNGLYSFEDMPKQYKDKLDYILPILDRTRKFGAKLNPANLLGIMIEKDLPIPERLLSALDEHMARLEEIKNKQSETTVKAKPETIPTVNEVDPLDTELEVSERRGMGRLIYALASSKVGIRYNPESTVNGYMDRIQAALQDVELKLDEKTVRKYLKVAKEELDRVKDQNQ